MANNDHIKWHTIYKGPSVEDGSIDIVKLSDSLRSFSLIFDEVKENLGIKQDIRLKVGEVKKGSFDIAVYLHDLLGSTAVNALAVSRILMVDLGGNEITKPIFQEIGQMVRAKIFTKNSQYKILQSEAKMEKGRYLLKIKNIDNEKRFFDSKIFESAHKSKYLEKLMPISNNEIEEVSIEYESKGKREKIIKVDLTNSEYLKYNPITEEVSDKIKAKIRYVDDKTGNGKLWLDDEKKESCNFEIDIKDISILEKVISSLAIAEGKHQLVLLSGKKEYQDEKLTKIYVSDIDILGDTLL